jgi:hypothetical protein
MCKQGHVAKPKFHSPTAACVALELANSMESHGCKWTIAEADHECAFSAYNHCPSGDVKQGQPCMIFSASSYGGIISNDATDATYWCARCMKKHYPHSYDCPPELIQRASVIPSEAAMELLKEVEADASTAETAEVEICLGCKQKLCEVCGVCETEECLFLHKAIKSMKDAAPYQHLLARTQKIKGFVQLASIGLPVPAPYRVVLDEAAIQFAVKDYQVRAGMSEMFVRPCPIRPRHGFVESRGVRHPETEVAQIFREAREADPEAELLLLPKIDAALNLVITPSRVAVGLGHDGATAGRAGSVITLPLMGTPFAELNSGVLKSSCISDDDDPYVEAVVPQGMMILDGPADKVRFTQLRAGAKLKTFGYDFIPEQVRAEKIIEASGDLLEWEKQVAQITRGTVVCMVGGSLISHYGVHCVYNNIPVMTSRRPVVGELLVPTPKIEKPDPKAVIDGLAMGAGIPFLHTHAELPAMSGSAAVKYLLTIFHNSVAMSGADGKWLGAAAALMLRAGMAASHGEARHASQVTRHINRDTVYEASFKDFFDTRKNLHQAQYLFKYYPHWGNSFGGKAWAKCTEALINLDTAALNLVKNPSDDTVTALVTCLNIAINQAHNGGWWLNKFVHKSVFDCASAQSLRTICSAAPMMMALHQFSQDGDKLNEIIATWEQQSAIEVPQLRHDQHWTWDLHNEQDLDEDNDSDGDSSTTGQCDTCGEIYEDAHIGGTCGAEHEDEDGSTLECEGTVYEYPTVVIKSHKKATVITPTHLDAIAAEVISVPSAPSTVTLAHGYSFVDVLSNTNYIHVQYKIAGEPGYKSFNVKVPSTVTLKGTGKSWAGGSENHKYVNFDLFLSSAISKEGWWCLDPKGTEYSWLLRVNPVTNENEWDGVAPEEETTDATQSPQSTTEAPVEQGVVEVGILNPTDEHPF